LGSSIISLVKVYDIFIFLDVIIVWYLCKHYVTHSFEPYKRRFRSVFMMVSVGLLTLNFVLAEIERPQLFSRGFDREYLVKNVGIFYYHIYDVVMQSKLRTQRVLADANELETIKDYIKDEVRSSKQSELFGVAEDRNVIFISAESMQTFHVNNTLHGDADKLFLNTLRDD